MIDIIEGHVNELFNKNEEMSKRRMLICLQCPLYLDKWGGICNPKLALNPETGEVAKFRKNMKFVRGCGCRLNAKTRVPYDECVAGKWGPEE